MLPSLTSVRLASALPINHTQNHSFAECTLLNHVHVVRPRNGCKFLDPFANPICTLQGIDQAKLELREIVDFLKNPEKYTVLGAKIPKGCLLVGAPGTGESAMLCPALPLPEFEPVL